jgi:hypothetical protein
MIKVELIYDSDCPNVKEARAELLGAFAKTGLQPLWVEWQRGNPESPPYIEGYGSPAILVNGKDVAHPRLSAEAACCRVYYGQNGGLEHAPSAEVIAASLVQANSQSASDAEAETERRHAWRGVLTSIPAIGTALLPKIACPACWPAYAGLLSALGIGFINYTPYLLPLTLAFLAITAGSLWWQARRTRRYLSFLLGISGSGLLLYGKFVAESEPAMYGGLALLALASFLGSWRRVVPVVAKPPSCPACAPGASGVLKRARTE